MIFKSSNGEPLELYVLTSELLTALVDQAIPFDGLKKIPAYHEKLSAGEAASFIACELAVASLLGIKMPAASALCGEGHSGGMIQVAFNALDSKAIAQILQEGKEFHSMKIGPVIVIAVDAGNTGKVRSWNKLKAASLSTALVETIYEQAGYIESHFGKAPESDLGVMTLAEVYRFLHRQNP